MCMAASVLVVGGAVAALVSVAALRARAGPRVELTVVAPATSFEPAAMSVTAPFEERSPAEVSLPGLGPRRACETTRRSRVVLISNRTPKAARALDPRANTVTPDRRLGAQSSAQ